MRLSASTIFSRYEYAARRVLAVCALALAATSAFAQKTIYGTVTDQQGEPLFGVSVVIKGTGTGTVTDAKGKYQLRVNGEGDVVVFRFLGMDAVQKPVKGVTQIDARLKESASTLSEVTVVSTGYQHLSRERSTASFGFVDSTALNRQNYANLQAALEGQVAGLRVNTSRDGTSREPIIRGVGTLSDNVGTLPLIVIDDMPTNMSITDINPYIVESITVLKDAAASSIYGARAANGVIVITTKEARHQGVHVNVNADWFLTTKPSFDALHLQSTSQYIDNQTALYNSYVENAGSVAGYFDARGTSYYSPLFQLYRDRDEGKVSAADVESQLAEWRQNDYYKEYRDRMWRTSATQRYNVALSQRAGKSDHSLTFNYSNSKGQEKADRGTNTFAIYYKSDYRINKWLTIRAGIDANLSQGRQGTSYGYAGQERYLRLYDDNGESITYPNASYGGFAGQGVNLNTIQGLAHQSAYMPFTFNAVTIMDEGIQKTKSVSLRPFASVDIRFLRFFHYALSYQYEWSNNKTEQYYAADSYAMRMTHNGMVTTDGESLLPEGGRYYQGEGSSNHYTFRNQLSFDWANADHSVNAITGVELRQNHTPRYMEQLLYGYNPQTLTSARMDWESLAETGFDSELYGRNTTFTGLGTRQTITRHRYGSWYANAGYTYKGLYNLTGSIRIDEADLFGLETNDQKHPLWSVGLGWLISEEKFMKSVSWLDYLRLRATYGVNGNVDQSSTTYFVATYRTQRNPVTTTYLNYDDDDLPNPHLRWEKTATTNLGFDFRLFNNLLNGSLEYYNRAASDLLVRRYMDSTLGAKSRVVNNGKMRNRGVELTLNANLLRNRDWNITAGLTFAYNTNKITDVSQDETALASSFILSPNYYFVKGTSYNTLWAYHLDRIENGYPVITDEEGNDMVQFDENGDVASITSTSTLKGTGALRNVGKLTPTYNGGLSLSVRWREIELNAMFIYSGGNKLRMPTVSLVEGGDDTYESLSAWDGTNGIRLYKDMSETARQFASTFNDWWAHCDTNVKSAAFVKMRSVSINYRLPRPWLAKVGVTDARLRLQVNNLLTWAAAGHDIDPETFGLNGGSRGMKTPKTVSIGLSASF